MQSVACSLVPSLWASVSFPFGVGELTTSLGELAFQFSEMLDIFFDVGGTSSRKPALDNFTPMGKGAVVKILMMLSVLPAVLALGRCLLIFLSLWSNAVFFGWRPFCFQCRYRQ